MKKKLGPNKLDLERTMKRDMIVRMAEASSDIASQFTNISDIKRPLGLVC